MPTQSFPSRNKFPVIGTRGITYFAQDTSVEYVWYGTGYAPQNLFVKEVGSNFPNAQGKVSLPIETVTSTTTTLRKAETKTTIADTDKAVLIPTTGNLFLTTWANVKAVLKIYFDEFYELLENKATDFTTLNNTLYPSVLAVYNFVLGKTGTTVYLTAGDVSTTSNVPIVVTGLTAPLEANKRYRLYGTIRIGCNNTGGVGIGVNAPAGSTIRTIAEGLNSNSASLRVSVTAASGSVGAAFTTANTPNGGAIFFADIETAATAGNFELIFSSIVNLQTSTIYDIGTWITIVER